MEPKVPFPKHLGWMNETLIKFDVPWLVMNMNSILVPYSWYELSFSLWYMGTDIFPHIT